MADIFHEVDEEVRKEQLKKLWDRYGILFIALAVLVVVGVAGWRGYQYYENKKSAEAGAQFESAAALLEQNKHDDAAAAFAKIINEAPAGYRTLARLRAAASVSEKDSKAAVAAYDAIANDGSVDRTFRDAAAVRAALLLVDSVPFDEMRQRLDPQAEPGRPFRHTARELLALSAWRNDDLAAARRYVDMIGADAETPQGVRQRAEILLALLGGQKSGS